MTKNRLQYGRRVLPGSPDTGMTIVAIFLLDISPKKEKGDNHFYVSVFFIRVRSFYIEMNKTLNDAISFLKDVFT